MTIAATAPLCIACEGKGKQSRTPNDCVPCAGTGYQLTWVSPTQISNQSLCRRKRWYISVAKIKRPQHPSAVLGSAVHSVIERYLTGAGEMDPASQAGAIAIKALYLLPPPPQHFVELNPRFPRNNLFGYTGKIDLFSPNPLTVIDHKTSSNPRRYGLTVETLPRDPQAIIYSWFGFQLVPNAQLVNLQWNYIPTRKGKAYPVRAQMQRGYVDHALSKIDRVSLQIIQDNAVTDPECVPGDISACGAFGGCPYKDICSVPKQSSLALALSEGESIQGKTMAIDSDLLAQIAAASGAPPATPPPAVPIPAAPVPVAAPVAPVAAPVAPTPAPVAAPVAPTPAPNDALAATIAALAAGGGAPAATPGTPLTQAEAVAVGVPAPPAAQPAAPHINPLLGPNVPGQGQGQAPAAPAAVAPSNGAYAYDFTLYIDCIPLSETYRDADELIAIANKEVCDNQNVPHYKCIEYGKGPGYLAEALSEVLKGVSGNVVVMRSHDSSNAMHCLRYCAGGRIVLGV